MYDRQLTDGRDHQVIRYTEILQLVLMFLRMEVFQFLDKPPPVLRLKLRFKFICYYQLRVYVLFGHLEVSCEHSFYPEDRTRDWMFVRLYKCL